MMINFSKNDLKMQMSKNVGQKSRGKAVRKAILNQNSKKNSKILKMEFVFKLFSITIIAFLYCLSQKYNNYHLIMANKYFKGVFKIFFFKFLNFFTVTKMK